MQEYAKTEQTYTYLVAPVEVGFRSSRREGNRHLNGPTRKQHGLLLLQCPDLCLDLK
jgi:hypothetical protein